MPDQQSPYFQWRPPEQQPQSYGAPNMPHTPSSPGWNPGQSGFNTQASWSPDQPTYSSQPGWNQPTQATGYQNPPNYYQPPQPQPQPPQSGQKRPRRWPWIVAIIVALFIGYAAGSAGHSDTNTGVQPTPVAQATTAAQSTPTQPPTPTPTPKPTAAPKWTTTHTFTGSGVKKTSVFTVADDWKVLWTCNPTSFYGGQYAILVTVYGSDGTVQDLAVDTICKSGNTGDQTEEHQGGTIYLEVDSVGYWSIQIQELQ